jgi:hypothetical protein
MNIEHRIQTIADLFNLVTLENVTKLSFDLTTALVNYANMKEAIDIPMDLTPLPESWYFSWIDHQDWLDMMN